MTSKCALIGAPCPKTSDDSQPRYCPAWWETTQVNEATGEVRVTKGCGWAQLPQFLNFMAHESRGAAVSAQEARNAADALQGGLNKSFRAVALTLFSEGVRYNAGPEQHTLAPDGERPGTNVPSSHFTDHLGVARGGAE